MNIPVGLFLVSSLQLHRAVVVFDHVPHERHTSHTGKRDAVYVRTIGFSNWFIWAYPG